MNPQILNESRHEAFEIVHSLYKSMDFPQIPLKESLTHSEGKHILLNIMNYLCVMSETQQMRAKGIETPNYPSSCAWIFEEIS